MSRYFQIIFTCSIIAMTLNAAVASQEATVPPKVLLLWPQGAPGAQGDTDADKPTLTIYLPPKDKATGTAVVICPGGGYGMLAIDYEGYDIAQWLNSLGVAGFVLKYRHNGTGYKYPAPLQDAQRAISIVRSHAKEWNLNPYRIGIMGFSAGGHLASTVGTHFKKCVYEAKDYIGQVNCRPDFMILAYPVISFVEPFTHYGSRKNLLGDNPDKNLVESLSNEKQVTSETPPTFLVHGSDDTVVPVENSIYFYLALRKAGIPAEMHIYEHGPHGFGLGKEQGAHGAVSGWPDRCVDWMRGLGLLTRGKNESK
jgi:acetyl esterase/lipase